MNIFVTGGSGFIGRPTVEELKKRGHRLLVLSRTAHRERGVDFIKGDLSDILKLKARLKKFKPEAAVHLGWEGIPNFSYELCAKNLSEGLTLFGALAEVGCKKIVATGTGFSYNGRTGKVSEDMAMPPPNAFTSAKQSLHLMGAALAKEKGMDFIWLRPFNPYGGRQRAGSLIPFIMRCVADETPLMLRGPLAQGDFIYVGDVGKAFADAVTRGKGNATYNVGSGKLTSIRDIAKLICEGMGASREYSENFARTAKGKLVPAFYADLANVKQGIGWAPTTDIKKGIKKTIAEYTALE